MSRVIRKPDFCLCGNKGAEKLQCNREADQRLYPLSILCGYTTRFVFGLVGDPEDRISRDAAHIVYLFWLFLSLSLYSKQEISLKKDNPRLNGSECCNMS